MAKNSPIEAVLEDLLYQAVGFPAMLPLPEEMKQVQTALGTACAEQSRDLVL